MSGESIPARAACLPSGAALRTRVSPVAMLVSAILALGGCALPGGWGGGKQDAAQPVVDDRLWVALPNRAADSQADLQAGVSVPPVDAVYTVRRGDSLAQIAARLTGSRDNWQAIAAANGIDDPSRIAVGTQIVVPADLLDGAASGATDAAAHGGVDLLDALGRAQDFDATFAIAREQYDVTQAGIPLARGALLPQAGVQAEIGRFMTFGDSESTVVVGTGGGGDYTQTQYGISLSQAVFDRPAWLTLQTAKRDADIAEVRLLAAHEDLLLRVARAYFDVLRAGSELEYRSADLDAIRRQLVQSERRFEVGAIAITDVTEARAQRDLAEAAEIVARNVVADAREALIEITGLDSENFSLVSLDDAFNLQTPDPADVEAWVGYAEKYNTALIAARGSAELATDQVSIARAQRWLIVDLTGAAQSIDSNGDSGRDGETGSLSLTATLPLLTGGQTTAQIAQQQARARVAAEQTTDTRRQVVRGTRNAYRGVLAAISQVRALQQALDSTRQAARATQAGFDAGTRTSVEVLQSLRDTFRAQADYASARYDYIVNSLALRQTAGTLTSGDVRRVNDRLAGG